MSDFEKNYRDWHTKISYVKSAIRIGSCGAGIALSSEPVTAIVVFALGFMIAEVLGVLEEAI